MSDVHNKDADTARDFKLGVGVATGILVTPLAMAVLAIVSIVLR